MLSKQVSNKFVSSNYSSQARWSSLVKLQQSLSQGVSVNNLDSTHPSTNGRSNPVQFSKHSLIWIPWSYLCHRLEASCDLSIWIIKRKHGHQKGTEVAVIDEFSYSWLNRSEVSSLQIHMVKLMYNGLEKLSKLVVDWKFVKRLSYDISTEVQLALDACNQSLSQSVSFMSLIRSPLGKRNTVTQNVMTFGMHVAVNIIPLSTNLSIWCFGVQEPLFHIIRIWVKLLYHWLKLLCQYTAEFISCSVLKTHLFKDGHQQLEIWQSTLFHKLAVLLGLEFIYDQIHNAVSNCVINLLVSWSTEEIMERESFKLSLHLKRILGLDSQDKRGKNYTLLKLAFSYSLSVLSSIKCRSLVFLRVFPISVIQNFSVFSLSNTPNRKSNKFNFISSLS